MNVIYYVYFAAIVGLIALIFAFYSMAGVLKKDSGDERMQELSQAIFEGAMAFLNRQYRTLIPFVIIVAIILLLVGGKHNIALSVSFLVGTICSALAGYLGMTSTTKANARTAQAAKTGINDALEVSFKAGVVMGMSVVGLALFGVSILYIIFESPIVINSFAFGASAIAFFARIGGGIFTKAADVGADLVGKIEAGIPEDDPRNPAVIADNVGDNVGDTAGMGADLFESYGATAIASMLIGNSVFGIKGAVFPLLVGALGIIASLISTSFVRVKENRNPQTALNLGLWGTNIITAILTLIMAINVFGFNQGIKIFITVLIGLIVNVLVGLLTEFYTSSKYKPTKVIAKASQTGSATNLISGIANGFHSTTLPMIIFCFAIGWAYKIAGVYGISMAAVGMLCTAGMVIAMDSFGPVADNAGGIAEMAKLGPDVRKVTDELDSVGNTTAAIAKGFAIGSAALTAIALFQAYESIVSKNPHLIGLGQVVGGTLVVSLTNPKVLIGMLLGASLPFLICAFTMESVGKAAFAMIEEVRRQFREIPGIMENKNKPDYNRCIDISTKAAIKEMIKPGIFAVGTPLFIGFVLGAQALAGFFAGVVATGVLLALFMSNAGGAWDNAKKHIETGKFGGRGSKSHAASVVGDTVGDPFKDTSGPAMNPLIKVVGTVSLLIAPFLLR